MPQNFSKVDHEKTLDLKPGEYEELARFARKDGERGTDRIAEVLEGQVIFITGGTGFLGKVLVEKLLRACPGIKKIFLLIRGKKGKTPQERLKETFENELFSVLKKQRDLEELMKHVEAVEGDVSVPHLGLSEESRRKLTEEVTLIYHCAATIRFDEPLRKAVFINTRGTKYMLQLARECENLRLFAYISTAYSVLNVDHVLEQTYDPPTDPENIIRLCEILDDETIKPITKKILGDYPNSYSFTKCLSEGLVSQSFNELPAVILRPSIIIPIWKEPLPGWTDNINGPTGLLIGAGKGVMRTMLCDPNRYGDYLPVDLAVNGIIVCTWSVLYLKKFVNRVGHMTSSKEIQVTWAELIEVGRWVIENKVPLNGVAWYPGGSMKKSKFQHDLCVLFFHWIPAILIDTLLWCLGYPPVLCRVQRRITKGFEVFEYYTNREWSFDNTQAVKMRSIMNETEKKKYIIEKKDLDLFEYFEACTLCARRYILKTPDDMIPAAKRHMKIMWCVDRFCKALFVFLVVYFLYTKVFSRLFSN